MALIPPAIIAALLGASIGNSIKQANNPPKKNRITFEPFPGEIPTKSEMASRKGNNTGTAGGSARKVTRRTNQKIFAVATNSSLNRNVMPRSLAAPTGLILTHCEPVFTTQLTALGVLSYQTVALIPSVFPYLNGIASNFAKYSWLKMHIYYTPSCPTSTLGEQAMANFYDWQDAAAATFTQTATMKNGITFPPWGGGEKYGKDAVTIDVDVKDFDKPRYNYVTVATFNALTNSDKNNYAPVNIALASQGSTLAVPISGRIWIEYVIRLIDPIPSAINS